MRDRPESGWLVGLLFRAPASHQIAVASFSPQPPGCLRPNANADRVQDQRQATLLRLLPITEAFAADLLGREVEQTFAALSGNVLTAAVDDSLISATNSRYEQSKAYEKWPNVKKPACGLGSVRAACACVRRHRARPGQARSTPETIRNFNPRQAAHRGNSGREWPRRPDRSESSRRGTGVLSVHRIARPRGPRHVSRLHGMSVSHVTSHKRGVGPWVAC